MGSWRKQSRGSNHLQAQGNRGFSRKPPSGAWQPTVPEWEKEFCWIVGSVPWNKLLESQRYANVYDKVINWNDSAVKDSFDNAKKRFWADINGIPCDISLPDHDIYIDEIDWNYVTDPELLLELEKEPEVSEMQNNKGYNVLILGDEFLRDHQFFSSGTGWGSEEKFVEPTNNDAVDPKIETDNQNVDINKNSWEPDSVERENNLENNGWDDSFVDKQCESNGFNDYSFVDKQCENNDWKDSFVAKQCENNGWKDSFVAVDNQWESNKYREVYKMDYGSRANMSRYKTSRFDANEWNVDRVWRNDSRRENKVGFGCQQSHRNQVARANQWK